ncbi:MAG: DNRLRE domain-containing protein, partial [Ruminococcaceae bacterium]|nr:DNRLRE domain-containing protein [Oscillospiraceae bacterium]
MSKFRKITISVLSIVLVVLISFTLPVQVAATATPDEVEGLADSESIQQEDATSEGNIIGEDTSKRDEYTKHFITDAGTTIAAQYAVPVHYKDANGEYVDFDNSLVSSQVTISEATEDEVTADEVSAYSLRTVEETEETFTNKKSNSKVSHFKKSGKAKLIEITRDGHTISWGYSGANIVDAKQQKKDKAEELTGNDAFMSLPNLSSKVLYENIYNNVDLEVINSTVGVKENLILKDSNTKNVFNIEYNIGELTAESTDNQTIVLKDAEGTVLYTISAPYMADAKGEKSEALELKILKNNKGKLSVKLTADKEWLKDKSRVYPVTVDPAFTYGQSWGQIKSTYVNSGAANTSYTEGSFYVGRPGDNGIRRSLIKIPNLPKLNIGDMVVNARIILWQVYNTPTIDMYVGAYESKSDWTDLSSVTWNNQLGFIDNLIDYEKCEAYSYGWRDLDITELVKKWYNGADNNGFYLTMLDESNVYQGLWFSSSLYPTDSTVRPELEIAYRNNKGLEERWTYTPISAGSAGTAYINDYSGNLVFQFGVAGTSGLKLPTALGLTYNSYMADSAYRFSGNHTGYGWKTNLQQTVVATGELDLSGSVDIDYPYVYTDEDGTDHYFYEKTDSETNVTEYIDEDGLGLELEIGTDEYIITDKNKTKRCFTKSTNKLARVEDSTGQEVTLSYHTDLYCIDKITDANGKIIQIGYDGGRINAVTDPAGRVTCFGYNSSWDYLTSVTYPDGTMVQFGYDSEGLMTSVTDIDGKKLLFEYAQGDSRGVKSVQEVAADGTYGQKITFDRTKYNTTKMQTAGVDCVFGNSDDIITIYQFDNWGRTVSVQSKNCQGEDLGASAYTYTSGEVNSTGSNIKQLNKTSSNYSLGANRENILKDHSFESLTNWTSASWGTGTVDFTATMNNVSEKVLYGEKSLKLSVNSVSGDARGRVRQDVPIDYLTPGATYTLSAYVRVENLQPIEGAENYGAVVCVTPWDNDDSTSDIYSDYISRNTDTSINKGFRRISVTFQMPQNSTITGLRVQLALRGATGTAYFDAVQLEKSDAPSTYNMLENASFERFSTTTSFDNWSRLQMTSADCKSDASVDGNRSFRITGDVDNWKNLYQIVYLGSDAKEEDTYTLSGWATANSVPIGSNEASFRLLARVYYTDNTYKDVGNVPFNDALENVNWQYASGGFTLGDGKDSTNKTPYYLKIYLAYSYQGNKAYFDNLQLTREPVPSYTYDKEGNLISVVANKEQKYNYTYEDNLLTKVIDPRNTDYEYTYEYYEKDNVKTNLLKSATTQLGAKYSLVYDDYGNATSMEGEAPPVDETSGEKLYLKSETEFNYSDADASVYSIESSDQDGNKVTSVYDANKGTLTSTTATGNPDITTDDITTTYTYYENNDLPHTITNGNQSVSYTYDNFHNLTGIEHEGTTYSLGYDKFGNRIETKVGNRTLATNTYAPNNGYLQSMTYGNHTEDNPSRIQYTYDRFGNKAEIKYGNTVVAKNIADSSGAIIRAQDLLTNHEHRISYDSTGRLISKEVLDLSVTGNRDKWLHSLEYNYDLNNNVSHFAYADRNVSFITAYTYGKDNLLTKTTLKDGTKVDSDPDDEVDDRDIVSLSYSYDNLGRLTGKNLNTTNAINTTYTYHDSDRGTVTEDG